MSHLKLTSKKVSGSLSMLYDENLLAQFLSQNKESCSKREEEILQKLKS
jgi:DNA-binding CsgD family transcriptional regulator